MRGPRSKPQQLTDSTPHGSRSTYANYRCRCQLCRDAAAAYIRDRYQRRLTKYGIEKKVSA